VEDSTSIREAIRNLRATFDGFNSPASESNLAQLQRAVGPLPYEVLLIYHDHDGSNDLPRNDGLLAARLMPVSEVMETRTAMIDRGLPKVGSVAWLWTDDNSNYCGIYTDGLLAGWLTVLDHEEPMLTPAFRSTASFTLGLLAEAEKSYEERAIDIPSIAREFPEAVSNPATVEGDRQLAARFQQLYTNEQNEDLRRLYAFCSICLTPFESTGDVLAFLADGDMWTPEAAVRLLEVRRWRDGLDQLERLAREGRPNGDSAAMRHLARMNTQESRRAIARLKQTLDGQKLQTLQEWVDRRSRLQPPRWP
jgi:hypothetical protein